MSGAGVGELFNYPFLVFAFTLIAMGVSVHAGALLRRTVQLVRERDKSERMVVITNASLGLLALIIGFSFSMAVSRYDQRKNYEEEEANAIGTEYARADLLTTADAARLRQLLAKYVEERIQFYEMRNDAQLQLINADTA